MENYNNYKLDSEEIFTTYRYNTLFDEKGLLHLYKNGKLINHAEYICNIDPASQDEEFTRNSNREPEAMINMIIDKIEKHFNINNSLTSLGAK